MEKNRKQKAKKTASSVPGQGAGKSDYKQDQADGKTTKANAQFQKTFGKSKDVSRKG